jgi:glycerol-3-phosphate dehydrogenase
METGKEYQIQSRVVVNATGVFVDDVIKMDNPEAKDIVRPSQGVHIVLDKDFLPGESAIMVPKTEDGRVLFVVPWNNKAIVGTTDTPVENPSLEPKALEEEVEFILEHAAKYLSKDPTRKDVQSVFAGLRPLVSTGDGKSTAQISRSHSLMVSISGLVTITGGKWTTYRKMGEDTIDKASLIAGLEERQTKTKDLRIHGWLKNVNREDPLFFYGSDIIAIRKLINKEPELGEQIHKDLPVVKAQVIWAAQHEMARTVEDFLSRRTRSLLLNARASIEMAPEVARLLARELDKDKNWEDQQVKAYTKLAEGYILK